MQWHARMEAVKMRHLEYASVPVRVHENGGGFDVGDINGGGDETISSAEGIAAPIAATPVNSQSSLRLSETRTSELTISFEGEVYVFHAVTPEKVRLLLQLNRCWLLLENLLPSYKMTVTVVRTFQLIGTPFD